MSILVAEIKKLLSNKNIIVVTILLIFVNISISYLTFAGHEQGKINYTPKDYKETYISLENMTADEARNKIVGVIENTTDKNSDDDMPWHLLMSDINGELAHICSYQDTIDNYIALTDDKINSGVGSLTSEYAKRELLRIFSDLNELKDTLVKSGPVKGLMCFFNSMTTDFVCIIFILILLNMLIISERMRGDINLYIATVNGHSKLALAKYSVTVIMVCLFGAICYFFDLLVAFNLYGAGDLNRSIQSLPQYGTCSLKISILEGIILDIIVKFMVYAVITGILYIIFTELKSILSIYTGTIMMFGCSIAMYYSISDDSSLSIIKNINLFAFMDTGRMVGKYKNIDFLGIPVNYLYASFVVMLIAIIVVIMIISDIYDKPVCNLEKKRIGILDAYIRFNSLFVHELVKVLMDGRVIVSFTCLTAFAIISLKPVDSFFFIPDTLYEDAYLRELKGNVTEDKINTIDAYIENIEDDMEQAGPDSSLDSSYNALMYLRNSKTEYLKSVGGDYLVDTGYRILTGDKTLIGLYDSRQAAILVIFLAYPLAAVFGYDRQYGMNCIIDITYRGFKTTKIMRMTLALILSTLIYIMVYIPMYYEVIKKYGFESASSPACSLEHLSSVSNSVSILEYLIIVALIRYVGVLILIMLSALLSRRVNGVFQITTAILAIVAVPLVLSYIGIPGTEYLLLNPLFIGNVV